jgi:nucleotide-binding universal stress UspA family protein
VRTEEFIEHLEATEEAYKLAIGYDPEDEPSPLFDYSFDLAELLNAQIYIVHALEHVVLENTQKEEKNLKEKIEKLVKQYNKSGLSYKIKILYGKDIENFNEFIKKKKINLFAFYLYKKRFGRSLAEEFLENLACSLFIVKEEHKYKEISKVLVPIDFSESSFLQKEFILRLKTNSNKPLEIIYLHVLESTSESTEEVELLFKELFEEGAKLKIRYGEPAEEILDELEEGNYDLAVLGKKGRGVNVGIGKKAQEVAEESPCPVVLI